MKCACDNCKQDFTDYSLRKDPPLILDFLDKNPQNTTQDNLRALCFNCVYSLYYTHKGWYRHRDKAIHQALEVAEPEIPTTVVKENDKTPQKPQETPTVDDNLTYIPFEEFQKTLK
jgi:ATP/maltotriose-dependent transcriptional regulator MalT